MRNGTCWIQLTAAILAVLPRCAIAQEHNIQDLERRMESNVKFVLVEYRRRARPNEVVKEAMAALQSAATVDELRVLPSKWEDNLSPSDQRGLIRELAEQMSARTSTPLSDPAGRPMWHPRMSEETKNAYLRGEKTDQEWIKFSHDVMMLGGRCAWALEELLFVALIPVVPVEQQLYDQVVRQNTLIVLGEMAIPPVFTFEKMNAAERAELARTVGGATRAAHRLSRDKDVTVRRALAARADITEELLNHLAGDGDEQVRRRAYASVTRKLENDIPP